MTVKELPKVELHVHLDGSIPYSYFISKGYDIDSIKDDITASSDVNSLNDYLKKFSLPVSLMQDKDSLIEISRLFGLELLKENVIYVEVRFAPLKHTLKGLSIEEVVESVKHGLKLSKIKFNLILCMMRDENITNNKKIIDLAHKYNYPVDLAGAEALYKTSSFKELFDYANSLNVKFTIHAGEADNYTSVLSAISFGAKRIGHGVTSIHDYNTLNELRENNILLEVCVTSNIQTEAFTYSNHPVKKLYDDGILISINTDNRTVSGISLSDEYQLLLDKFNFSLDDLKQMNLNAIEASFLTDLEKKDLKKYFLDSWKQ